MRTRQGETFVWGYGFALPRLPSPPPGGGGGGGGGGWGGGGLGGGGVGFGLGVFGNSAAINYFNQDLTISKTWTICVAASATPTTVSQKIRFCNFSFLPSRFTIVFTRLWTAGFNLRDISTFD